MSFVWLGVIILAAAIEAGTTQLVSIWAVAGGIAALIAALCGGPIWLQGILFIIVTVLALLITRPLVKRSARFQKTGTNADRYIGKTGIVIQEINNTLGEGQVNVLGSIWSARSEPDQVIAKDSSVFVKRIEGVKLIVSPEGTGE